MVAVLVDRLLDEHLEVYQVPVCLLAVVKSGLEVEMVPAHLCHHEIQVSPIPVQVHWMYDLVL